MTPNETDEPDALVGRVLGGRYRIDARIGQGGFGAVYRATHIELLQPVAIKTLLSRVGDDEALLARFRREARLQAGLRHHAIVRLQDFGREPGGPVYMVQEFIEGRTLHAHLAAVGRIAPVETVRLIDGLLDGLAAAHRAGVVHRDLKPANVMLVAGPRGDEVRILDFGLAKMRDAEDETRPLTVSGQILGTPAFMAPEQIEQRPVSPATDVYAVGVMLHLMLTGRRPFSGPLRAVLTAHLIRPAPPLPPDVPAPLAAVVQRAMAKEATDRFPSAEAMQDALRAAVAERGSAALPSPSAPTGSTPAATPPAARPAAASDAPAAVDPAAADETLAMSGASSEWRGALAEARPAEDPPRPTGRRWIRASLAITTAALLGAAWIATRAPVEDGERVALGMRDRGPVADAPSDRASAGAAGPRAGEPVEGATTGPGPAAPTADPSAAPTADPPASGPPPDAPAVGDPADVAARRPSPVADPAPGEAERPAHDAPSPEPASDEPNSATAAPRADDRAARAATPRRDRRPRRGAGPRTPKADPPRPAAEQRDEGAEPPAEDPSAGRSVRWLVIEGDFDRAVDGCRCDDAAALIERAAALDPRADLDPWRARHLRACVMKAGCP